EVALEIRAQGAERQAEQARHHEQAHALLEGPAGVPALFDALETHRFGVELEAAGEADIGIGGEQQLPARTARLRRLGGVTLLGIVRIVGVARRRGKRRRGTRGNGRYGRGGGRGECRDAARFRQAGFNRGRGLGGGRVDGRRLGEGRLGGLVGGRR